MRSLAVEIEEKMTETSSLTSSDESDCPPVGLSNALCTAKKFSASKKQSYRSTPKEKPSSSVSASDPKVTILTPVEAEEGEKKKASVSPLKDATIIHVLLSVESVNSVFKGKTMRWNEGGINKEEKFSKVKSIAGHAPARLSLDNIRSFTSKVCPESARRASKKHCLDALAKEKLSPSSPKKPKHPTKMNCFYANHKSSKKTNRGSYNKNDEMGAAVLAEIKGLRSNKKVRDRNINHTMLVTTRISLNTSLFNKRKEKRNIIATALESSSSTFDRATMKKRFVQFCKKEDNKKKATDDEEESFTTYSSSQDSLFEQAYALQQAIELDEKEVARFTEKINKINAEQDEN